MILVHLCVCHHLRLLWRLNFLGQQILFWFLDVVFLSWPALILPKNSCSLPYISQGQTVKILDHTFSEIHFKILPKLLTTTILKVCSSDRSVLALTFEVPVKATLHWRSTRNWLWGRGPEWFWFSGGEILFCLQEVQISVPPLHWTWTACAPELILPSLSPGTRAAPCSAGIYPLAPREYGIS